ncbi:MAG TPA: hypothetical protein PLJ08_02435, partial [Cyclobacteriaceae bacterium]|nr:hypothetical protein [Cyclobacteriaceae bacterium]
FTWTPAINLNNSQSVTPTFSSAVEGNYSYNVTVKDLNGCTGSGQVFVNVSDAAGDVTGTPASYSRIIVSWKDRSNNETGYLIRKSIGNNSSYFDLVTVEPNITSYEDTNVLKDVKYYYHVIT